MSRSASASQTGLSQQAAEPEVSALSGFDPSRWQWRTDRLPYDEQPIYQFVLLEGYQEHSGRLWHRRFAGTATIAKSCFSRFGYRCEDIDRIQRDGDMVVVERVLAWMPATWPRGDFDASAIEAQRAETGQIAENANCSGSVADESAVPDRADAQTEGRP